MGANTIRVVKRSKNTNKRFLLIGRSLHNKNEETEGKCVVFLLPDVDNLLFLFSTIYKPIPASILDNVSKTYLYYM